jgi:hypothetical protein
MLNVELKNAAGALYIQYVGLGTSLLLFSKEWPFVYSDSLRKVRF